MCQDDLNWKMWASAAQEGVTSCIMGDVEASVLIHSRDLSLVKVVF